MKYKLLLLLGLVWTGILNSQVELVEKRFAFDPQLTYDPAIPAPEAYLGYQLGEQFSLYANVVQYFEKLAASSEKIIFNQYGETYEGRPLINVVITSVANQRRLETLRLNNLKLVNPGSISKSEADQLMQSQPLFLSYSYNIHGNEASSTEAVMQVAYRLVAATDAETKAMLENSVVVLYICINPDGRDRYAHWVNSVARKVVGVEPNDLEHHEPWPGGRTNHYWFDVNRDWVWGIHPEGRGLTAEYQRWMPQVHNDYHEQGYNNNYFTMPGTTPRNKLLPDRYEAWSDTFGMANIREFNRHKIDYFTREAFDFFYPGYGSSYPSVMGAIGMLTEQGGIGAGRAIETEDGYVLTFRQRIFDHYTTSIAMLKKAIERKRELMAYTHEARDPSKSKSPVKAYFLPDNPNGYLYDVLKILLHHGIKVEQLTAPLSLRQGRNFRSNREENTTLPAGTYVVSTQQPAHLLINSILSRELTIEDSVMYDMATWSLPLAYNLEAYSSNQVVTYSATPVLSAPTPATGLSGTEDAFAYVIDWNQRNAPQALAALWAKKYRVRATRKSFSPNGKQSYAPGALIVITGRNLDKKDQIHADMKAIAEQSGVKIEAMGTGRMLEGIDLMSRDSRPVEQPKAAMLIDPPFDSQTAGQISFLFDQETGLPLQRIRASVLQQTALPKFGSRYGIADLKDFDVLILPGGGEGLRQLFGKEQVEQLKAWINGGGTLVAAESAVPFLAKSKSGLTELEIVEPGKDSSLAGKNLDYADREDYFGKKRVPGTALYADMDPSNPLAFGVPEQLYTLKFDARGIKPTVDLQSAGRYPSTDKLFAAGYISPENLKTIGGQTFAAVLPMGRGKIVLLLDNTQFRMFWRGPSRMMQNAVMLVPGM